MEEKNLKTDIFEDKLIKRYFKLSLFLISTSLLFIVLKFRELPPQVPLFYSLPWGEKQLTNKFYLFLLPFGSIIILLSNIFLAKNVKEELLIAKLLLAGALLFSILSTITLIKIILLVT